MCLKKSLCSSFSAFADAGAGDMHQDGLAWYVDACTAAREPAAADLPGVPSYLNCGKVREGNLAWKLEYIMPSAFS